MTLKRVTLVIPTYNEAKNIKSLLDAVSPLVDEVLVIDDNSKDGTAKIAKRYGHNVKVIVRPRKMGLNSAIYFGALNTSHEFVAVMDGDFSHPPDALKRMLQYIPEYDIVIGTRAEAKNWTITRNIISFSAKLLATPFTGRIRDPISGFFIAKRKIILKYGRFAPPEGYKMLFTILKHYIRSKNGCKKIKEVYYVFNGRKRGKSKLGRKQMLLFVFNVVSNIFYQPE